MKTERKTSESGALAAGFTLTELLVSMLVLAVGCMAVIKMQASGMNAGDRAGSMAVASILAESQAETLNAREFNAIQFVSNSPERLTWDGSVCPASAPAAQCFFRTTNVLCPAPTSRSCEVSIEIQWQAADGPHKLVFNTVMSDIGF